MLKSLLIVTMLDYNLYSNSRTHHLVKHFKPKYEHITLMFKKNISKKPLKQQLRTIWSIGSSVEQVDNITTIETDPFLNHTQGLGITVLKLNSAYHVPPGKIKKFLRRFLSFLGTISEFAILPSFLIVYLFKVREKFDVFIGQGPWEMFVGYVLYKCGRVKLLIYDDFDYAPGIQYISSFRRFYTSQIEKLMLKKAHQIISVGDFLAQLRKEQVKREAIVIPNGVDYKLFQRAQSKQEHPLSLIYTGYIGGWSGLDLILQAMYELRKEIPELRLLALGHTSPYYFTHLEQTVSELGLKDKFHYAGNKSYADMIPYLKQADIGMALFQPIELRKYAFSIKIIEYMAAGLPIITTKGLQSACVVDKHRCGKVVNYDVKEVAEAIMFLLSNREFYHDCVNNAISGSQNYKWKDLMDKEYNVIKQSYDKLSSTGLLAQDIC